MKLDSNLIWLDVEYLNRLVLACWKWFNVLHLIAHYIGYCILFFSFVPMQLLCINRDTHLQLIILLSCLWSPHPSPHETWSHLVLHIVKPRGLTWRRQEAQQVGMCACLGVWLRNYEYGTCKAPVSKGKCMIHNTDPLMHTYENVRHTVW